MLVPIIFVSRKAFNFTRFCLFVICIGYFENGIQGSCAFLEITPTRCTANTRNLNSASTSCESENTFQKPNMVESRCFSLWNPHYPIHSLGVPISQRIQMQMQLTDNEHEYASLSTKAQVPVTRIRDVPLRVKSKALSLYTRVSKKIVYTKQILMNVAPSLSILRRMKRKSTSAIGTTKIFEHATLQKPKQPTKSMLDEITIMKSSATSVINNPSIPDKILVQKTPVLSSPSIPKPKSKPLPKPISTVQKHTSPVLAPPTPIITTKPITETTATKTENIKVHVNKARLETCHPDTNLAGKWSVVVTPTLKKEYDMYLQAFQQPAFFRAVALNVLSMTKDTLQQSVDGREFTIIGTNPRGVWSRTLFSSGYQADWDHRDSTAMDVESFEPKLTMIRNAGGADVDAECWWEDNGKTHTSWVRNAKEGDFYSRRYIDEDGFYICESKFYHNELSKVKYGVKDDYIENEPVASMTWKFERED